MLSLHEPRLLPYQDGPFTLYREASCRIELEVVMDRATVKSGDPQTIEQIVDRILVRHDSRDDATASAAWNGRAREPYPEDYETTLNEHAIWQAEQANGAVQARLGEAAEETRRVADRIESDPDYLAGLAAGVARALGLRSCPALLAAAFARPAPPPVAAAEPDGGSPGPAACIQPQRRHAVAQGQRPEPAST